jgi:hypothetical protein
LTAWHAKVPLSLSFNDGIFSDGQYIFPSFKMLIDVKTPSTSLTQNTDVTLGTPYNISATNIYCGGQF